MRYQPGGQPLTGTGFSLRHRWVFGIVLSNPDAARLYRLPFARYAARPAAPRGDGPLPAAPPRSAG